MSIILRTHIKRKISWKINVDVIDKENIILLMTVGKITNAIMLLTSFASCLHSYFTFLRFLYYNYMSHLNIYLFTYIVVLDNFKIYVSRGRHLNWFSENL